MQGVLFAGSRTVELAEFADPRPGPRQVVVKIMASGICGSDLRPYRSERRSQFITGHEPCGVVDAVGEGVAPEQARVGDRVIVHHYSGCGTCKHCRVGYTQMCLHGHVVYGFSGHGGNAPYMLCEPLMLVPLPDELGFAEGAAVACGTGTAYMALKRLDVSGRDTLAVYGQGPVGLSATMLAEAMGARVVAIDVEPARLELARELGAAETVDGSREDPVERVRALTHGEGAETALDCTGNATARAQAVRCARSWGRVCWVGEGGSVQLEPSPEVIHKQLTIYGSWTFSTVGLAECAQFIADRKVPLGRLITDRFRLAQAEEAFALFDQGKTGKCVFVFD
ncbi:MAG TPA: zinc-binding dehydrogenase [Chloroflexota bacterium]